MSLRSTHRGWLVLGAATLAASILTPQAHAQNATSLPPPVSTTLPWKPTPGLRWQIQYVGPPVLSIDADVYMLDMFDTDAKVIAALKARGKRAVCYINAGAWEDWRPDKNRFPKHVLGAPMGDWPGERWLDTRQDALRDIMARRLDLCRKKGFDGVIFDNVNSHTNPTGFPLAAADSLRYNAWLANAARSRALAAGMNNNSEQTNVLEPYFDWALAETCFREKWCANFSPFVANGKAVVAIEYLPPSHWRTLWCEEAARLQFYLMIKAKKLTAPREDCRDPVRAPS